MWIHESKGWPAFKWDIEVLSQKLSSLRYTQGKLLGRMEGIGFDLRREANLNTLTSDVIKSSAIEGEHLSNEEVRSSVARKLGMEFTGMVHAGRHVEGIVDVLTDATANFQAILTKDRLFTWHAALFPTGRSGLLPITVGNWRKDLNGPMRVVSGPFGRKKVHFEAPSADLLESEMVLFLNWFNSEKNIDPILKAGIAHLWFVTLHPFDDGNGRIGRAIADMALARADGLSERFYSLSSQIETERKAYYFQLESQQRGGVDATHWLDWFIECLRRAIDNAEISLEKVFYKAKIWEGLKKYPINERQSLVLNRMLEGNFEGFMNTSKYAQMAKCSNDTALRDIQDLKRVGVFVQNLGKGRSTSYRLPENIKC